MKMFSLIHICRLLSHLFLNSFLQYALPSSHFVLLRVFANVTLFSPVAFKVINFVSLSGVYRQLQPVTSVTV